MALDTNVYPAVANLLAPFVANGQIKGYSDGAQFSIPQSPWCWIEQSGMVLTNPLAGTDLESTTWEVLVRLLHEWGTDQTNAEVQLKALIEPIRAAVRAHIKMGQSTIVTAYVAAVQWGYMFINEIWYRNCDLQLRVVEKVPVTYGP